MTLTIHGSRGSRARRPLWVARELGLTVENIEPAPGDTRQPAYLAINPNGKVPTLEEDDFVLFESFAQSLYLAKKFGLGGLYPADPREEALVWQWTFWGLGELEKNLTVCLFERMIKPEDQRDTAAAERAEADLQAPLAVLDSALDGRAWLLAETFTVADINLAAIGALAVPAKVALDHHPQVARWLQAAMARPAYNG